MTSKKPGKSDNSIAADMNTPIKVLVGIFKKRKKESIVEEYIK